MSVIDKINIKGTNYDIHDRNAITVNMIGVPNGIAELDENGYIPSAQLPDNINSVYEYENKDAFPEQGEADKIYIAEDTNLIWRWDGNDYVSISSSVELGETSDTAYRGDRGKIAYDHSQASGNPHGTTKADLGLSNVSNNKSLAVDELQNLTPIEQETARTNIGAGTLADVKVNGVSVVDVNEVAQVKSYKEVTQAQYDALPSSKLSDDIMYCITDAQNGGIFLQEITQAEYDALPSSLKNSSNTIYFITDGGGSGGSGVSDVLVNGTSVVSNGVATITMTDENVTREYVNPPYEQNVRYNILFGDNTSGNGHAKMVGGIQYMTYYPYDNIFEISSSGGSYTDIKASGLYTLGGRNSSYTDINADSIKAGFQSYAMTMNHQDIVLTNGTWDGTNTSLKTAINKNNYVVIDGDLTSVSSNTYARITIDSQELQYDYGIADISKYRIVSIEQGIKNGDKIIGGFIANGQVYPYVTKDITTTGGITISVYNNYGTTVDISYSVVLVKVED